MINAMRHQSNRIATLEKDNEERRTKEVVQKQADDTTPIINTGLLLTAGPSYGNQSFANGLAPQTTGYRMM